MKNNTEKFAAIFFFLLILIAFHSLLMSGLSCSIYYNKVYRATDV